MSNLLFSVFPNENFVDIGLYQYGWEQCEPSHSFGPAARNHYIFHYVISGTGTLMADDSSGNTIKYQVKSGQGFMLFPNQINTYIADQDLPWEYTWIEFDGLRAKEIVSTAGLSPDHPVYHAGSKDLRNEMMNEMLYIARHPSSSCESPFHIIGHLYLFLDYFMRSAATVRMNQSGKIRDFYIKEALSYIEQNFQNNITIEDIASFFLWSEPELFRKDFSRLHRKISSGIPDQLPHDEGCRTSETDFFIHCGYWKCRRISESVTFFKSIQEYLWNFSKKLAQ